MHIRFEGSVALVTGAAQGIGQAIAVGLQQAGAQVFVADMDGDGLRAFAGAHGLTPLVLDIGGRAACHAAVDHLIQQAGRLDILVNAAGGVRGQTGGPVDAVTPEKWRAIFEANVDGAFWLAQA
ncbi:MAG: SDR family oxidoreductase, partial [Beijerinckiaceae bacterium]